MREGAPQRNFVVIGGSGGIGSAVCQKLVEGGARVALTYRKDQARALALIEALRKRSSQQSDRTGEAHAHRLDALDSAACEQLFEQVSQECGPIDGVIHAAGSAIPQPYISQVSPSLWRQTLDTDVGGFFHVVHGCLKFLRQSRGSLTAITSAGNYRYPSGDILSVAPKAAIESLIRGVAKEEGRHGVRANAVAVGVVDAGMFPRLLEQGELSQAWVDAAKRNTPLRRFAEPQEIADAVFYLASPQASYVTGQTLRLDGGYSL